MSTVPSARRHLNTGARAVVVLVHGLWMPAAAMALLRRRLEHAGHDAILYGYPSLALSLTQNADRLCAFSAALEPPVVHWVGHSLGGLVILRALQRAPRMPPGRIVLMGTPYGGSAAGRTLAARRYGAYLLGRSLREWDPLHARGDFGGREIGMIAGNRRLGMAQVIAPDLARPNDGVVTLEETAMPQALRIVLPVSHSAMLVSRAVAREVDMFLRTARFSATDAAAP